MDSEEEDFMFITILTNELIKEVDGEDEEDEDEADEKDINEQLSIKTNPPSGNPPPPAPVIVTSTQSGNPMIESIASAPQNPEDIQSEFIGIMPLAKTKMDNTTVLSFSTLQPHIEVPKTEVPKTEAEKKEAGKQVADKYSGFSNYSVAYLESNASNEEKKDYKTFYVTFTKASEKQRREFFNTHYDRLNQWRINQSQKLNTLPEVDADTRRVSINRLLSQMNKSSGKHFSIPSITKAGGKFT